MTILRRALGCTLLLAGIPLSAECLAAEGPPPPERFRFGAAGEVTLYRPSGAPEAVVLFVSGDGGWNQGVVGMAERLRGLGALVAGIDIRSLLRGLEAQATACSYPAGDLEELSRAVQLRAGLAEYLRPILVGYSSGATLVYAALAQAPPETFAGAISLGFCPDLETGKILCGGRGLRSRPLPRGRGWLFAPLAGLGVGWHVLQGGIDQVCDSRATAAFVAQIPQATLHALPKVGHGFSVTRNWDPAFVEAYRALARRPSPVAPSVTGVTDLPLVEVPAAPGTSSELMAVLFTGDGGWADIDKGVAGALAARGVPVVGWSSLRYFWTSRTPETTAADLDRVVARYLPAWGRSGVLLVGYSFGADVLPYVVARLSPATRARVRGLGLLGLSRDAAFTFHVTSWIGEGGEAQYPTVPEVARLAPLPVVCVRGDDESDSACDALHPRPGLEVVTLPGGHHFGGDWPRLAATLLEKLSPR
jgi:type IV secretory pathway VirJ component